MQLSIITMAAHGSSALSTIIKVEPGDNAFLITIIMAHGLEFEKVTTRNFAPSRMSRRGYYDSENAD